MKTLKIIKIHNKLIKINKKYVGHNPQNNINLINLMKVMLWVEFLRFLKIIKKEVNVILEIIQ